MPTRILSVALVCVALAACADEGTAPGETPGTALRVINAASTPVDVVVDGRTVLSGLAAAAVSPRLPVTAAQHSVRLRTAGTAAGADLAVSAATGRTTTVYAHSSQGALSAAALSDTGAAPVAGKSKLRVAHLAGNAPPIDVWRTQPDYTTPIRVMFPFAYRAESNYMQSDPGAWQVSVTREGETGPALAASGAITVAGGEVRTVVILDAPGGAVKVVPLDER